MFHQSFHSLWYEEGGHWSPIELQWFICHRVWTCSDTGRPIMKCLPFISIQFYKILWFGGLSTILIQFRVAGGLKPIPEVIRQEAGFTLDRSPVHHRATQRQTTTHAHTHSLGQILKLPINLTCMFLGDGRKPEYPERTHAYTERTCKLHTERPQPGTLLPWDDGVNHHTTMQPLVEFSVANPKKRAIASVQSCQQMLATFTLTASSQLSKFLQHKSSLNSIH